MRPSPLPAALLEQRPPGERLRITALYRTDPSGLVTLGHSGATLLPRYGRWLGLDTTPLPGTLDAAGRLVHNLTWGAGSSGQTGRWLAGVGSEAEVVVPTGTTLDDGRELAAISAPAVDATGRWIAAANLPRAVPTYGSIFGPTYHDLLIRGTAGEATATPLFEGRRLIDLPLPSPDRSHLIFLEETAPAPPSRGGAPLADSSLCRRAGNEAASTSPTPPARRRCSPPATPRPMTPRWWSGSPPAPWPPSP